MAQRLTKEDALRAEALWEEYQRTHDVSARGGQTAGIDPETGRLWFGESIPEVIAQRDASGVDRPLHFVRIGSTAYYRKGSGARTASEDSQTPPPSKKRVKLPLVPCGRAASPDEEITPERVAAILLDDEASRLTT